MTEQMMGAVKLVVGVGTIIGVLGVVAGIWMGRRPRGIWGGLGCLWITAHGLMALACVLMLRTGLLEDRTREVADDLAALRAEVAARLHPGDGDDAAGAVRVSGGIPEQAAADGHSAPSLLPENPGQTVEPDRQDSRGPSDRMKRGHAGDSDTAGRGKTREEAGGPDPWAEDMLEHSRQMNSMARFQEAEKEGRR